MPSTSGSTGFSRDVLITIVGKGVFALFGALLTVIVARELGPDDQGVFAVAFSLILILIQVGSLGLSISIPTRVAQVADTRQGVVGAATILSVAAVTAMSLLLLAVHAIRPRALADMSTPELIVTLVAVPAALLTFLLQGVLVGERRMVPYSVVEVVQSGGALAVVTVLAVAGHLDVFWALGALAGGRWLALCYLLSVLRPRCGGRDDWRRATAELRRLLAHGMRVYIVSLTSFALMRIDMLVIGAVLPSGDAGQYSVAVFVADGLSLIPMVVALNLIPRLAASGSIDATRLVFSTMVAAWAIVVGATAALFPVVGGIVFGHEYDQATTLFLLVAPGVYFTGLALLLTTHFWVSGYPTGLIVTWVAMLVINVAGNVALLPVWGIEAAPILLSTCSVVVLVAHLIVFVPEAGGVRRVLPSLSALNALLRAFRGVPASADRG